MSANVSRGARARRGGRVAHDGSAGTRLAAACHMRYDVCVCVKHLFRRPRLAGKEASAVHLALRERWPVCRGRGAGPSSF
eukprot:4375482-Prymnesium_polylepis.1